MASNRVLPSATVSGNSSAKSVETIVVGAGSAGSVIAARMTERSARQVLLIEAGPDYPDLEHLPGDLRDGTRNSMRAHDWGFAHSPTRGQVLFGFPRGRVVGGSSAVNTCIALRGQPYDYDEWGALGLPDWSWEQCLPAFKRIENDLDVRNQWHSQDGPIPIRRHKPDELVPWQAAFLRATAALGFPTCSDHNDPTQAGAGPHAMNKVDGQRMSAARCYLTPEVRRRPNLTIRARTRVRRVLFDNRRVSGVEVETDGDVEVLLAKRVVLSAGAILTPAILLRSGIGPREIVARLGIELVAGAPAVGARLLDHPGAGIFLAPRPGVCRIDHPLIQNVLRYTSEGSPYPNDMQVQPGSLLPLGGFSLPVVTLMCCVGKPRGIGKLEFRSADPSAKPRIVSQLLENDEDRARAVEALELAWLLARTPDMRELAGFFWPPERTLSDRDALDAWILLSTGSGYHPCGTVPMGPDSDESAAVDGRGRLRGVEGLIVADASIMPTIPSSNTNLPTLMIGERFGAWLRDGEL
jgi:choline dehydrogenase